MLLLSLIHLTALNNFLLCDVLVCPYKAIHQLVTRGKEETLKAVLPRMRERIGPHVLADILNVQAGPLKLGTVDTALKCCMRLAPLLKAYGGKEQQHAPDDWKQNRRRNLPLEALVTGPTPPDHPPPPWKMRQASSASGSSSWGEGSWSEWSGGRGRW